MFLFLFTFGIYSTTNIINGSFYKSYVYLTYWGEVLTMLAFSTLIIDNILYLQDYYSEEKYFRNGHLSRAAHIIFESAFSYQLAIVLMYWIGANTVEKNSFSYITDILEHGFCFILLWIDNILNFIEFFPRHMLITLIIGILYGICNAIVVFCINYNNVYAKVTWIDGMSYVYAFLCLLTSLLHFQIGVLFFRNYKWKKWGQAKNKNNKKQTNPQTFESQQKIEIP